MTLSLHSTEGGSGSDNDKRSPSFQVKMSAMVGMKRPALLFDTIQLVAALAAVVTVKVVTVKVVTLSMV